MLSAIAAFPLRSMVTISSALASPSWARMVLRRPVLAPFGSRFATSFGFAVLLRAAVFFAGAFRGLVLFQKAGLHQTAGLVPLDTGDDSKRVGWRASQFKQKHAKGYAVG
jgi:hypothetical protein